MSTPRFLTLPRCARAVRLETARGGFAALEALPAGPVRATALLVPGFTGSKEDFIALLEPLSTAGYRVVAVDQRGQHETGGPADEAAYALPELGRDVLALTEAVGGPVHLLGHSFGGYVVRQAVLAAGEPLPWRSLTLLSTGPAALEPAEAARTKLLLDALAVMDLEAIWQVMKELEEGAGDQAVPPSTEVADFLHRRWLANVPQSLAAMGRQLIREPDRVAELAAVPLPKLVLSGVRDYAWPVAWQSAMAERLGARRVVVPDAGHSPNAERPAETAGALLDFWSTTGA
ncbi:alpha/beta fold hydrolase [Streptomyces sp. NPDC092296]|uniref:alpha/beta fold hydrolase n=1 Tax=Streptomyces sp. NPDC092296 TaxID=3366012 RepID=UPI00382BA9B9